MSIDHSDVIPMEEYCEKMGTKFVKRTASEMRDYGHYVAVVFQYEGKEEQFILPASVANELAHNLGAITHPLAQILAKKA